MKFRIDDMEVEALRGRDGMARPPQNGTSLYLRQAQDHFRSSDGAIADSQSLTKVFNLSFLTFLYSFRFYFRRRARATMMSIAWG